MCGRAQRGMSGHVRGFPPTAPWLARFDSRRPASLLPLSEPASTAETHARACFHSRRACASLLPQQKKKREPASTAEAHARACFTAEEEARACFHSRRTYPRVARPPPLAHFCRSRRTRFPRSRSPPPPQLLKKAEILTERDPPGRAVTFNNLACYYRRQGKLHASLQYLQKALKIEARLEKVDNPADTHLNACAVLSQLGRHQSALEHAQSALILLQEELFNGVNPLREETNAPKVRLKEEGRGRQHKGRLTNTSPYAQPRRTASPCSPSPTTTSAWSRSSSRSKSGGLSTFAKCSLRAQVRAGAGAAPAPSTRART
jgi:tetratricopeptide (TPR) repeat protein